MVSLCYASWGHLCPGTDTEARLDRTEELNALANLFTFFWLSYLLLFFVSYHFFSLFLIRNHPRFNCIVDASSKCFDESSGEPSLQCNMYQNFDYWPIICIYHFLTIISKSFLGLVEVYLF